MTTTFTIYETRWTCPQCGRFIAEASVQSEDHRDDGAYYGVSSRTWGTCARHGRVEEPNIVQIKPREVVVA